MRPSTALAAPGVWRGALVVGLRELAAAASGGVGAVTVIAFLLASTSLFMNEFFLVGRLDMTPFFDRLPALFVLFLPAITMRSWAEERRHRTFELLVTLPLRPQALVLGKFAACKGLLALMLVGTAPIVVMLVFLGEPDPGLIASGYLGAFLFGAWLLALGSLVSALTRDQIVAFVGTALLGFLLVSLGDERVVAVLDGLAPERHIGRLLAGTLSPLPHYEQFVRGVVDLGSCAFFVLGAAVALGLTAFVIGRERE